MRIWGRGAGRESYDFNSFILMTLVLILVFSPSLFFSFGGEKRGNICWSY